MIQSIVILGNLGPNEKKKTATEKGKWTATLLSFRSINEARVFPPLRWLPSFSSRFDCVDLFALFSCLFTPLKRKKVFFKKEGAAHAANKPNPRSVTLYQMALVYYTYISCDFDK